MARLNEQIPSVGTVMLRWLLVMLGLNALVTAVICIYIMRRLGSPILAIDRALNDIGDGNLNVRLRETDSGEFNELCVSLNRATAKIQSRIEAVREEVRVLESLDTQPAPSPEDVHNAVQNCRNVLSFFRADSKSGENAANGDS